MQHLNSVAFRIFHYLNSRGQDVYEEWLEDLDHHHSERVDTYVTRMRFGNFGVSRSVGGGVTELKVDFGPGYRVYYLRDGEKLIILLGGGTKDFQSKDISAAQIRAKDYWKRK
jgi:putative addiction module killer protein